MGEVTAKLVITVFVSVLGGSFQFYNLPVINPPQAIIKQWINETYYQRDGVLFSESTLTTLFSFTVSIVCLGAFIGCTMSRALAEGCGRRNGLIVNGIITVFGGLCVGICKGVGSPELLLIGRFILGVNVGITSGLVPLYLTEIAPVKYRGACATTHQIAVAFSDLFSLTIGIPQLLGTKELWPLAFSLSAIPALLLCCALPFCEESPRYLLITKGRRDLAEKSLKFFVGEDKVRGAMETLIREAAKAQAAGQRKSMRTRDLFHLRELRTPLLISILSMVAQQFTGAAAVFSYSTDMFQQANLSLDVARISTVAVGAGYFFSTVPAIWLVEVVGRRKLSLFQLSGCFLTLIMMSTFTGLQTNYGYGWASYASIGALVCYMIVYGVGSAIPWMLTSELFQQEYRSSAVAISTFVSWILAFIISFSYLPFQQAVGASSSFLPFIIVLFVAIILMFLFLPETRGKTIDEIVDEFRERKRGVSQGLSRAFSTSGAPESEPLLDNRFLNRKHSAGSNLYTTGAHRFSKNRLSTQSEEESMEANNP